MKYIKVKSEVKPFTAEELNELKIEPMPNSFRYIHHYRNIILGLLKTVEEMQNKEVKTSSNNNGNTPCQEMHLSASGGYIDEDILNKIKRSGCRSCEITTE